MRKVLFVMFSFVLCLALCACGGMSGEKAAGLYPDIIGQWGTDPFGEEFVLTLSEDGSCTILGNDGTWKLNSDNSNEEQVELSVKTENTKYHVELGRVQKDSKGTYHTVSLLIMDAKEETEVYDQYVFSQEGNFVSAELAMHTVPELIGEWGSYYWTEEAALTIREDGTCSVLCQPGKWCLRSDFSTWPKVVILIELENGQRYDVELSLLQEDDRGYLEAGFDIYDPEAGLSIPLDPYSENPVIIAVNRNQVVNPLDTAQALVGAWTETGKEEPYAIFDEDGTCTLSGADGLWSLNYAAYYNEKYRNGWDYSYIAKTDEGVWDINIADHGNGQYNVSVMNPSTGMHLIPFLDSVRTSADE